MNLSPKYIVFFVLLCFGMLGWNAFLITRDNKLFDAYYGKTRHQQYCEQLKEWHPDCKVE